MKKKQNTLAKWSWAIEQLQQKVRLVCRQTIHWLVCNSRYFRDNHLPAFQLSSKPSIPTSTKFHLLMHTLLSTHTADTYCQDEYQNIYDKCNDTEKTMS